MAQFGQWEEKSISDSLGEVGLCGQGRNDFRGSQRPEEGGGSPSAGATGNCEPLR